MSESVLPTGEGLPNWLRGEESIDWRDGRRLTGVLKPPSRTSCQSQDHEDSGFSSGLDKMLRECSRLAHPVKVMIMRIPVLGLAWIRYYGSTQGSHTLSKS